MAAAEWSASSMNWYNGKRKGESKPKTWKHKWKLRENHEQNINCKIEKKTERERKKALSMPRESGQCSPTLHWIANKNK